jgi:hypothetical protein
MSRLTNFVRRWVGPNAPHFSRDSELVPLHSQPDTGPDDPEAEDEDIELIPSSSDNGVNNSLTRSEKRRSHNLVHWLVLLALLSLGIVALGVLQLGKMPLEAVPERESEPYALWWEHERTLPQHNASLPAPEGENGRYVWMAGHMWGEFSLSSMKCIH